MVCMSILTLRKNSGPLPWTFVTIVVILLALLGACAGPINPPPTVAPPTATTNMIITAVPGIVATVTAASKLPDLSPEQAAPYLEIRELVQSCEEFHPNRRVTLQRHLDWLTHPGQVPP